MAIVVIALSVLSAKVASVFFLLQLSSLGGGSLWENPIWRFVFLFALGVAAVPILISIVLLLTKSKQLAAGLLMVLTIIWGLGIISAVLRPSVQTIVTIFINGFLITKALDAKTSVNSLM